MRLRARAACAALLAAGCAAGCAPGRKLSRPAAAVPAPRAGAAVVVLREAVGGGERYLGSPACGRCHPAAFRRWEATAHAAPLAGLPAGDAGDPSCLRCHATGHGDPFGHGGPAAPPGLGSVGCEACHGPSAGHAASGRPDLVPPPAAGGECPPCEANRICRSCHTPERDPDFDLAAALAAVSCGSAAGGGRGGRP